ncbi:MAG: glycoside hydrolase family 3 C-terminal domain-containing protein [Kiritimatiellales bacterium]
MNERLAGCRIFVFLTLTLCAGSMFAAEQIREPSFLTQVFSKGSSAEIESATSSSFTGENTAAAAIDGDLTTSWEAGKGDQAWLTLKLKEITTVESVYASWNLAAAKAGEIQASMDGENWQIIGVFTNGIDFMSIFTPCTPTKARYVRLLCQKRYIKPSRKVRTGGYNLREIAVNPVLKPVMAEYKKPVIRHYTDAESEKKANAMLVKMSLDQKLRYLGGVNVFSTAAFPEIGLPALQMDNATAMGIKEFPNTAFPATILLAATWNPELAALQGKTIGEECRYHGKHILLGPGLNIYRNARNGRNFEYMGEDPFLVSKLAVAFVRAIQEQGVMATIKHFVANNIEARRKSNNSIISERALREIYFPAFKTAIQEGGAEAVMTSYNLLNGTYTAENAWLIKEVLEKEWGFNGIVMSDWRSTYDPVMCFNAGLDLEMPYYRAMNPEVIKALLAAGVISEAELNDKVRTILYAGYHFGAFDRPDGDPSFPAGTEEHFANVEKVAEEGIVLLKNRNHLLPLPKTVGKIILAGPMADNLPPTGTGSGAVGYPKDGRPVSIKAAFEQRLGADHVISCGTPEAFAALSNDELAAADAVIACVGFNQKGFGTKIIEGEGRDRPFELTEKQNNLISRCAAANPRTVVAVTSGGGIDMNLWKDQVGAILFTWYTGKAGGTPLAKIVLGEINPSGRLPISQESKWEDSPGAATFAAYDIKKSTHIQHGFFLLDTPYDEDILVGYRYYDTKNLPVNYPFGFGLSYTTFGFSDLKVTVSGAKEAPDVAVSMTVKNTGTCAGKEVVQVYVHDVVSSVLRPVRELKGFKKVELIPGESRQVTIHLDRNAFMFFHPEQKKWVLEPGKFEIQVGSSSRDLPLKKSISL